MSTEKNKRHGEAAFLFLGTGPSAGVPEIGNVWGTCQPTEKKNRRFRCSALVRLPTGTFLIDTSPDLRQQLLKHNIARLDAVLYTHTHADHLYGIDELRIVNQRIGKELPFFGLKEHIDDITQRFCYVISEKNEQNAIYRPRLTSHVFEDKTPFSLLGVDILPLVQDHGFNRVSTAFRIGDLAYITDLKYLQKDSQAYLQDLGTLILGIQVPKRTQNHLGLDQALEIIQLLKPKRAYVTHLGKFLDYGWLTENLPKMSFQHMMA